MRTLAIPLSLLLSLACVTPSDPVVDPDGASTAGPIEQPGPTPRGAIELHPITLREGGMGLVAAGGNAYVIVEGEPIPLQPGQPPARVDRLGHGLAPIESMFGPMFEVVGVTLTRDAQRGVLVAREDFDRSGSRHRIYELGDAGWIAREREARGMLSEFYSALVTTSDGAVLGIREHELTDPFSYEFTDEGPEAEALWQRFEAERAAAPTGFALISGKPAVLPTLPSGWQVRDAASTDDGWIVALAEQHPAGADEPGPVRLLEWAPGQANPTVGPLPGIDDAHVERDHFELIAAGDKILVTGFEDREERTESGVILFTPYLAVGPGPSAARVAVDLPTVDPHDVMITSATRAPDGELWLTVEIDSRAGEGTRASLWRNGDGPWRSVELPAPDQLLASANASGRWIQDPIQMAWFYAPPGAPKDPPTARATSVLWAADELWVIAELGRAYPTSEDSYMAEPRTVLYASHPIGADGGVIPLPGYDELQLERTDASVRAANPKLGEPGCGAFTIVLLDDVANHAKERAAIAKQLRGPGREAPSIDGGYTRDLYVGVTFDDPSRTQLVFDANANSAKDAAALVAHVGKLAGVKATADCRPRRLVEPIE